MPLLDRRCPWSLQSASQPSGRIAVGNWRALAPTSVEKQPQQLFAIQFQVSCNVAEYRRERADTQGVVGRDGDVVRRIGIEPEAHMAP